ncbi:hypothetical protein ACLCDV_13310 [Sphingobacterium sp. Lzh-3]|uniref:hypothetical protein n=1 Tax=Sphingobacterium sp. Lzh-3 TaxID=3382150 RepID=UPI00398D5CA6
MDYLQKIRRLYNLSAEVDFGYPVEEIIALELRLGIILPAELKNYFLNLGKNEAINFSYNRLLTPAKEIDFSNDGYLMIYEENQAVVSWGIKKEDLKLASPSVWGNACTEENPDWYLETDSIESFFLLMAVYNGTFGGLKYHANYFGNVGPGILQVIEKYWTTVPEISYEGQKVYTDDFYELVSLSFDEKGNCEAIFIGSSDEKRFDEILDTIVVDWSYTSYEDED